MPTGIAIDLGATLTRVGLIDTTGKIIARTSAPTPHTDIPMFLISLVHKVVSQVDLPHITGIGISAAGPVNVLEGTLVNPPNLPLKDIPLVGPLSESFGLPVRLANDCHAGVIGEAYFGGFRSVQNIVYVTLSTGIGGGVISGGNLLLGRDGNAGEIGHFLVDTTYNLTCGCGYPGHWEGYASGRFLPSFFDAWCDFHDKRSDKEIFGTAREIFQKGQEGEPVVQEFLDALGIINGHGMSDVIVAYDPEVIILDGSVALNNPSLIIPPMEEHIDRFLALPSIQLSRLAGDAPLLGASVLAHTYDTDVGSVLMQKNPGSD
ncbi:MAG: ROK family protein [Methanomicrobiales archaeon]|nr:ROK family protein [Methanomicrobiales archaeon]